MMQQARRLGLGSSGLLAGLIAALLTISSSAAWATTAAPMRASFDFVSSGGQFSIADELRFGNGLTISATSRSRGGDTKLVGSTILLDPIRLTGTVEDMGSGISRIGIEPGQELSLQIFKSAANGGVRLATATYDPGEFIVIGASGILSGPIESSVTDLVLTEAGMGYSSILDTLFQTMLPIDFNVTLSAAGQDIAERIGSGALVAGSVAGSVAIVPEPSTALLLGLGLLGLSSRSSRSSQR